MKKGLFVSLLLPGLLLLTGCEQTPLEAKVPFNASYLCEDDSIFTVQFDKDAAIVTLADDTTLSLQRQPAASGFLYTSPYYSLRGQTNAASWTVGRKAAVQCQRLLPAATPSVG